MKSFEIENCPLEGSNLIEASAGTGKTYAITGLYLRLILEKNLKVEEILVVTFTIAATEELRGRIRNLLREALKIVSGEADGSTGSEMLHRIAGRMENSQEAEYNLREAIINFDRASISTIHSFCQGILLENAFESGSTYDTELVTDRNEILGRIADDYWRINISTASEIVVTYLLESKVTRESLHELLQKSNHDPEVRIVPSVEKPDTESAGARLRELFSSLKKTWESESGEIIDIITGDKAISRAKYRKGTIENLVEDTRIFMAGTNPMEIPDHFNKFAAGTLSESLKNGAAVPEHKYFDLAEDFMASYTSMKELLSRHLLFIKEDLFRFAEREEAEYNRKYNTRSYDDLIREVDHSLKKGAGSPLSEAVRKRYRAALIDEFQDTDSAQYRIFSHLFAHGSILFLIGDPKQAIYGFRGGDIFAYMNALKSVKNRYTLDKNWRSGEKLVSACNTFFSRRENPFIFREIDFPVVETPKREYKRLMEEGREVPAFTLCYLENSLFEKEGDAFIGKMEAEDLIARSVAMEIFRLVDSGSSGKILIGERHLKPEDIAVLVRKKEQALKIQGFLSALGIPGVLYGTESVFISEEASGMKYLLSAVAEPSNEVLAKTALSTPLFGYSGNRILRLFSNENLWNNVMENFQEYHRLWLKNGFMAMFNTLMKNEGSRSRILSSFTGERSMTNFLHIAELLHRKETSERPGPRGLIKWLAGKINSDRGEENQLRLESDGNAVSLITIHRSKGLEFPVVFSPFTWEGVRTGKSSDIFRFHDTSENNLVLDIGSGISENLIKARKEELAENIRLTYVALTRACNSCYFYWGRINKSESSAPAYLLHGEEIDESDPVGSLEDHMKSIDSKKMFDQLEKLVEESGGTIHLLPLEPGAMKGRYRSGKTPSRLQCGEFTSLIDTSWRISSYSSLVSSRHREDYEVKDRDLPEISGERTEAIKKYSMITFPRGTLSGNLLHEIFEKADLRDPGSPENRQLIESVLLNYRYDPEWALPVEKCLKETGNAVLDTTNSGFTLGKVEMKNRLNELEFCFPVEKISPTMIRELLSDIRIKGRETGVTGLNFQESAGFFRGFIDMVFKYGSRYYIVDWKSNFLGKNPEDYNFNTLAVEMESNLYTLQYYLYTLALHRYLSLREPGYSYEGSFGSVYYIFLRGVKGGSSRGVFSHRPDYATIADLEKKICGGPLN
jgi:exodeoxyribonuclease V beta subunit